VSTTESFNSQKPIGLAVGILSGGLLVVEASLQLYIPLSL